MPFDLEKFDQARFEPRQAVVPLDSNIDLKEFFGPGERIEWTVRGLSGNELHACNEASEKQKARQDLAKALAASSDDRVAAIRQALGLPTVGADATPEMAKRLEMFVIGSVAPAMTLERAVKFAATWPVEFLQLTHRIMELTGKGASLVKRVAASQPTSASSSACDSPSSEAASSTSTGPT